MWTFRLPAVTRRSAKRGGSPELVRVGSRARGRVLLQVGNTCSRWQGVRKRRKRLL